MRPRRNIPSITAMTRGRCVRVALSLALCASLVSACKAKVVNLKPESVPPRFRPIGAYPLRVAVTGSNLRGAGSSGGTEEGLADFLANEQIFTDIVYPYHDGQDEVDVILQARVDGDFRGGGAANFFTWFPGGLLLIPNFRGTRWTYEAHATVDALDAHTKQPIGHYVAETLHESIHRSASPGPFFSAALIIPAVIKGARVASPRRPYTNMLYAEAYPDLWKQIGAQIIAQEPQYLAISERVRKPSYAQARASGMGHSGYSTPPALQPPAPTQPSAPARTRPPVRNATERPPSYADLYSKRVAVVVGIDHYDAWPKLNGAVGDAHRMAGYLRDAGFDPVIEIYDGEATRHRLLQVLGNELGQYVDANSMAFIYFAGHGDTETLPGGGKRGYLIPADADTDAFATGISMETVRDLSNRMTAKHVLYAIDACYSGLALTRGISMPRTTNGYLRKVTKLRAVQILAAGSEGEQAIEIGGQGLFTTYLLRGMSGEADLDGDGAVTAREIAAYVRPQVTVASDARQTPQFGTIEGSGEVVFLEH